MRKFNSFHTSGVKFILPPVLCDRLHGPGCYYNIGNALGLIVGVGLQIQSTGTAAEGAATYLVGSGSAVAITFATLVFFWSGEVYHRAWSGGAPPDARLNRSGDIWSGVGAIGLGIGLLMLGQPLLAAFSGMLHAAGKFGSAFHGDGQIDVWPAQWPDPFRSAVLASRIPAIIAALIGLGHFSAQTTQQLPELISAITLLMCYVLWAKADLMLLRG